MSTRADNFTQLKSNPVLFSDFLDNLDINPITGALARVTNEKSISQALKNLVLTNYGERLFQPNVGCNTLATLFEPNDIIAQEDLKYHITTTINQNEPRVSVIEVDVKSNQLQDSLAVSITYSIINTSQIQSINLILARLR
jgi:phage baseplate assembly protein W